jgi:hypothetical protein
MKVIKQLPAKVNIEFVEDDDFLFDVEIQDKNGNPIDFSGWSNIEIQIRELESNGGSLVESYIPSVTAGGRLTVTIESEKNWSKYLAYEVEGTDGNSNNRTIIRGQIKTIREISE